MLTMEVLKKKTEHGKHQVPPFSLPHIPSFIRITTSSWKRYEFRVWHPRTSHSKANDKRFPLQQQQTHGYTTQKLLWSSI